MAVTIDDASRGGFDPGSFRDRNGRVFYHNGEVCRALDAQAARFWEKLAVSKFFLDAVSSGKIIATQQDDAGILGQAFDESHGWALVLKHERVPVISYPFEWCFGMLKDAALLQLDLAIEAAGDGFEMRDASSYNIQWFGSKPVFIDVASFGVHSDPGPWVGYRQFCRMFLNPLFLQAYRDVPFQPWLRGALDGIGTGELRNLFGLTDVFRRGVASHVLLHAALEGSVTQPSDKVKSEMAAAGYAQELLMGVLTGLRNLVASLIWKKSKTKWSDYALEHSYADIDFKQKEEFVRKACVATAGSVVWDVGANTGHFSAIAAETADYVLALEFDHLAVERHYQKLKASKIKNILPLYYDFANPSPALGWRNKERTTLVERARPALMLCLAVIHHLVISNNIRMEELVAHLAGLTQYLVIEFVGRTDPMTVSLLRAKDCNFDDYTKENFEDCLTMFFDIKERRALPSGHRILYFAEVRLP